MLQATYPSRQLSLGNRSSSKSSQSDEPSTPGALLVLDSVPIVRIISDEKPDAPPLQIIASPIVNTPSPAGSEPCRSGHCPVLRTGPALACNYCWNTIDAKGRILRRKTKYHCPECQTNLCIVPCFQEYHQRAGQQPLHQAPVS